MTNCDREIIEIERLTMELERAKSALISKWQPIATAPKDGTHVLLLYERCLLGSNGDNLEQPENMIVEGYFVPTQTWNQNTSHEFIEREHWETHNNSFHGCGCCGVRRSYLESDIPEPSAWMPIPKAPEEVVPCGS